MLFQTYSRATGRLTGAPLPQANAYAMIQRIIVVVGSPVSESTRSAKVRLQPLGALPLPDGEECRPWPGLGECVRRGRMEPFREDRSGSRGSSMRPPSNQ
jgi:hypothetical protein